MSILRGMFEFIPVYQQKTNYADQDSSKTHQLSNPERTKHKAVGPQSFNEEPPQGIEAHIGCNDSSAARFPFCKEYEEYAYAQVPYRFI